MYSDAKNMTNYLVESETLPMFALPKFYCKSGDIFQSLLYGKFLSRYCSFCSGTLASFRKGLVSFCIHITKLSDKCQSPLKADLSGRIVPILHPFASTVNYSVISVPYRQCARLTNRDYPTKPTKYRYARLLRHRLTVLKKTLNLQTYTRLRTRYMHSAGLWRILTLVSSTYRSILNQLESLFDREPLLMPI